MSDLLKEIVGTFNERLRSPILGSILLAFFIVNWRPLFFLFFSDNSIPQKFVYFDANTSELSLYLLPLLIGSIIAILSPWLKHLGALIAKKPTHLLKSLQATEAHNIICLLYTSPSPRDRTRSRMPSSA